MNSSTGMRLSALAIIAVSLLGALTARLWFLTEVEGEASVEASEANRIRTIHIQAPRGRIFDRNRQVLVDNQQVRQVRIDTRSLDETVEFDEEGRREVYGRLAEMLDLYEVPVDAKVLERASETAEEDEDRDLAGAVLEGRWTAGMVLAALEENHLGAFLPTPVANGVSEDFELALAERQLEFPAVDVDRIAVRSYPHGSLAAHALGYVGRINAEDLETEAVIEAEKPYAPADEIGRTGVEATYEPWLRGLPGQRVIEVNAEGSIVEEVSYVAPRAGMDLVLTLDLRVQALLERELTATAESNASPGAAGVVQDPRNGSIIAMASYPTYEPQGFINGISTDEYAELTAEENGSPLSNKVISGVYAPGSTFKPVTALAGLRADIITPADTIDDTGVYYVQGCTEESCRFPNSGETPYGAVNLARSLTVSSNFYYYRIGDNIWANNDNLGEDFLQVNATDWGFAEDTGVDLPQEQAGFAYTPEVLAQLHEDYPEAYPYGDQWRTGNTINMSIGQGDLGGTPLQLANMYAALANGGTLYRPHVGHATLRPVPGTWEQDEQTPCIATDGSFDEGTLCTVTPTQVGAIELPAEWRDPIVEGLLGVAQEGLGGTSADAFEGFDLANFPIAGKTGTAEVAGKGDFALYAGFGPVLSGEIPQYVIAVVYEDVGQFGGEVAAPVARAVFDGLRDPALLPMVNSTDATPGPSIDTGLDTDEEPEG